MLFNLKFPTCKKKSILYSVFFICCCVLLHLLLINHTLKVGNDISSIFSVKHYKPTRSEETQSILLWKHYDHNNLPLEDNAVTFPSLNCSISNCIFSKARDLFDDDYTRFDAILFNEAILNSANRPLKRKHSQIYIFHTVESSYSFPACELYNDEFFNWTLTYRLDSDITWSYFIVKDQQGDVIAPSDKVTWHKSHKPLSSKFKNILKRKQKAAAWLVSHCKADSLRDEYLTSLQEHLFHYGLKIDVYGKCSQSDCPYDNCEKMIKNDYYFYMAFENSLADDYVTEKVLHGYSNFAVPVVYGGANYSRFLPDGSYINAREIHPYNLAFTINQAIQNPVVYQSYFLWTHLYSITNNFKLHHPLCKMCEALHRKERFPSKTNFRLWWNGLNGMKWCLSNEYWNETAKVNLDAKHIFDIY